MADVKISELTAQASANVDVSADVLALVDTSATQTKKISVENLLSPITIDKSAGTITALGTVTGSFQANGGAVFNEDSADVDFRVESNNEANMLFVDGGNDAVSISGSPRTGVSGYAYSGLNIEGTSFQGMLSVIENQNDVSGGVVAIGHSRGTSANSNTILQDNDNIGRVTFNPNDGVDFRVIGAEIRSRVESDGSLGADSIGADLSFWTNDGDAVDAHERMTIMADGNVGIGETSPYDSSWGSSSRQLTITGTDYAVLNLKDHDTKFAVGAGDGRHYMSYDDNNERHNLIADADGVLRSAKGMEFEGTALGSGQTGIASSGSGGDLRIYTNGTQSTTFKADGKVGIGDGSPDALLSIKGDSDGGTTPSIRLKDGSDTREAWISNYSGDLVIANGGDDNVPHCKIQMYDANIMSFFTSNTERFNVDYNGTFVIKESTGDPDSTKLYLQSTKTYTDDEYENFDIAGRGAIVTVAVTTSGNQRSGLFFIDTASITVIKVADPSDDFAASDTDNKICVYKGSGNSNTFSVKNRKGGDRAISVGIITTGA